MAPSTSLVVLCVFATFIVFESVSAQQRTTLYPSLPTGPLNLNASVVHSKKGICIVEVPTIDLLSADQKKGGRVPQSNGTRPGTTKIEVCCIGYKRAAHDAYHCEPICDNDCVNGNCTSPNVCVCYPGHIRDLDNNCIPACPKGCLNGVCTTNGLCSCNAGFIPNNPSRPEYCIPHCPGGCGQGNCTAPGVCKCNPGFNNDPVTGKCGFYCAGGCGAGGDCTGPNKCTCRPGFNLISSKCQAHCPRGCNGGECVAPNQCKCPANWQLDSTGTTCNAHCDEPCLNGRCSAPNTCSCLERYEQSPVQKNLCVPTCRGGCQNGICTTVDFCICNPGFTKIDKKNPLSPCARSR